MNAPMLAAISNGLPAVFTVAVIAVIVIVAIWDGVWKLIAMWKSARNDQMAWYICLAIFNTAGILPILYILCFQKRTVPEPPVPPLPPR